MNRLLSLTLAAAIAGTFLTTQSSFAEHHARTKSLISYNSRIGHDPVNVIQIVRGQNGALISVGNYQPFRDSYNFSKGRPNKKTLRRWQRIAHQQDSLFGRD